MGSWKHCTPRKSNAQDLATIHNHQGINLLALNASKMEDHDLGLINDVIIR
jgi:hypothetical protein